MHVLAPQGVDKRCIYPSYFLFVFFFFSKWEKEKATREASGSLEAKHGVLEGGRLGSERLAEAAGRNVASVGLAGAVVEAIGNAVAGVLGFEAEKALGKRGAGKRGWGERDRRARQDKQPPLS